MLFSFCSGGDRTACEKRMTKISNFCQRKGRYEPMGLKKFRAYLSPMHIKDVGRRMVSVNDWTLVLDPVNLCNSQIGV